MPDPIAKRYVVHATQHVVTYRTSTTVVTATSEERAAEMVKHGVVAVAWEDEPGEDGGPIDFEVETDQGEICWRDEA